MASGKCFNDSQLLKLVDVSVSVQEQRRFEDHLESCASCRDRLDGIAGSVAVPAPNDADTTRQTSAELTHAIARLQSFEALREASGSDGQQFPFLSPSSRPNCLGCLGKYEILHILGEGGMAVVFAAWDPTLNREVAIKVPSSRLIASPKSRERFLREARSAAAVKHDNIVTVHAVENGAELTYLVMERIEGPSLAERLDRDGPLPIEEVAQIGIEIAAALQAAHARGLVHRDIKPGNILLEGPAGRVKVSDFGLAKSQIDVSLTGSGVLAGTPEFMSPEQANEQEATELSDLFSLGSVLYVACSGESPFRGKTAVTTLRRVCSDEVTPLHEVDPQIPRWFSDVVQWLMSKEPGGRPQSAKEVMELLSERESARRSAHTKQQQPVPTRPSTVPRVSRWTGLTLVAVAVVAIVSVATALRKPKLPPAGLEQRESVVSGFVVTGKSEPFSSLADAILAADQDGLVEVHGVGPYSVPSLGAIDKPLTIRAAKGSRPVFVPASEGSLADGPLLIARSNVDLEGIEVRWQVRRWRAIRLDSLADVRQFCVIDVDGGNMKLSHCRIVADLMRNGCVYVGQGTAQLNASHLVSRMGACCLLGPSDDVSVQLDHCVLEGRNGIMVDTSVPSGSQPARLTLIHNTMITNRAIQLVFSDPLRELQVIARNNAFDTPELMTVLRPLAYRDHDFSPTAVQVVLSDSLDWTESKNVYRADQKILSRSTGRLNARVHAAIENLGDWLALWEQADSGSVEATFEEPAADEDDSLASGPFAQVRSPKTSLDEPVGADLSRVGPEAY